MDIKTFLYVIVLIMITVVITILLKKRNRKKSKEKITTEELTKKHFIYGLGIKLWKKLEETGKGKLGVRVDYYPNNATEDKTFKLFIVRDFKHAHTKISITENGIELIDNNGKLSEFNYDDFEKVEKISIDIINGF